MKRTERIQIDTWVPNKKSILPQAQQRLYQAQRSESLSKQSVERPRYRTPHRKQSHPTFFRVYPQTDRPTTLHRTYPPTRSKWRVSHWRWRVWIHLIRYVHQRSLTKRASPLFLRYNLYHNRRGNHQRQQREPWRCLLVWHGWRLGVGWGHHRLVSRSPCLASCEVRLGLVAFGLDESMDWGFGLRWMMMWWWWVVEWVWRGLMNEFEKSWRF